MFASPALLDRLGAYGRKRGLGSLPSSGVISAGAPVQARTIDFFQPLLAEGADIHTPYGATEAVPIASSRAESSPKPRPLTDKGYGICVGRPINDTPIASSPSATIRSAAGRRICPSQGEIGEIVVNGPRQPELLRKPAGRLPGQDP